MTVPLSRDDLINLLGPAAPAAAEAWCDSGPRSPRLIDGGYAFDPDERMRRHRRLDAARRTRAHVRLAEALEDAGMRVRHACLAEDASLATKLLDEAHERSCLEARESVELHARVIELGLPRRVARQLRIRMALLAWDAQLPDEAERALHVAGAEGARAPEIRLLRARILNRRGHFQDSLAITRSLLRRLSASDGMTTEATLDLHARNLLLLGRGLEAVRVLDARLVHPGPTATRGELHLHLTRARCAREAGIAETSGSRILDLARVVREARRRNDSELEAQASFGAAIAIADAGATERALPWLEQSRAAWLSRHDDYHAAEVENSLAVYLHKLNDSAAAAAMYEAAISRLERAGEAQPLAVVQMNLADLHLDMLDLDAARQALSFAIKQVDVGVLRFKAELMALECHALGGAAADLVLQRLDELAAEHVQHSRPAVHAYACRLRARTLGTLGARALAESAYEEAERLYASTSNTIAVAETLVERATLADNRAAARSAVARALLMTRSRSRLVCSAAAALQGRPIDLEHLLAASKRRVEEVTSALARFHEGSEPALCVDIGDDALIDLGRLVADRVCEASALARFCTERLGSSAFTVLAKGPVDSWEAVAGSGLDTDTALRIARGGAGPDPLHPSVCVVENDRLLLVLVHDHVELRFGARIQNLAAHFLDLLARKRATGTLSRSAAREMERSDDAARRYRPDGVSSLARRLRSEVAALARSRLPIVIEGEVGTGKDRLARYLHALSDRSESELVVLDCAALPESLGESELLGHARGAFTGAERAKAGILEHASGGTLIIDDVAALPLTLQSLLMRALEHSSIRRIGEAAERPLDVRTVTLSRTHLATEVERGRLRGELFYRLQGAELFIPPLRKRPEDIAVLLTTIVTEENADRPKAIERGVVQHLAREPWPGNISELRNRVRRALLLDPASIVLGTSLLGPGRAVAEATPVGKLAERLRDTERELLAAALAECGGHRERAARQLGISRRWLQKRIRDLGLIATQAGNPPRSSTK